MDNAILVNADYESVLFHGKQIPAAREALEFLAFFLTDDPVISRKHYSEDYLDHVRSITGHTPRLLSKGEGRNWWGALKDTELERRLNSKLTSAEWDGLRVIHSPDELEILRDFPLLLKDPTEMSGRGFIRATDPAFPRPKNYPVIAEPLLDRVYDFSHYIFPSGKTVCYENIVDDRFQYKGTVLKDHSSLQLRDLSFFDELNWTTFQEKLKNIREHYLRLAGDLASEWGFSIDSFVYRGPAGLAIRALSEVNFRRTMGQITCELAWKYAGEKKWCALLILPSYRDRGGFKALVQKTQGLVLSPGDGRFEFVFLMAKTAEEGGEMKKELLAKA